MGKFHARPTSHLHLLLPQKWLRLCQKSPPKAGEAGLFAVAGCDQPRRRARFLAADCVRRITDALDHVEFMVLVLTDGAMQSPIVRKEWRYARQQGVCVYPVKGEPFSQEIHQSLPRWMRDAQYYDFDIEEQWQKFVSDLHKSCETVRVPFMVEDKPDDFAERPEEYNQILALLLNPKREEPIGITAAFRGAGSYGKILKIRDQSALS